VRFLRPQAYFEFVVGAEFDGFNVLVGGDLRLRKATQHLALALLGGSEGASYRREKKNLSQPALAPADG
jgi:hypothetical protein